MKKVIVRTNGVQGAHWTSLMFLSLINSLAPAARRPKITFWDGENLAQKIKETKWVCWRARDTRPLVPSPRGQIHRVQRTGPGGNSEIPDLGILHEMTLPDSALHCRDAEEIVTWKDGKDSFPGPYLKAGINKAYLSQWDDRDVFSRQIGFLSWQHAVILISRVQRSQISKHEHIIIYEKLELDIRQHESRC